MVAEQLAAVRDRIALAAGRVGRSEEEVTLVAVSKAQSVAAIEAAYAEGHRDFGENRAQELVEKASQLPEDIRWHFIGSLQSRKAKLVRPLTTVLHSLDRPSLVAAWARGDGPPPAVYVQVNIAEEPQKHGAHAGEVPTLIETASEAGLDCRGLMIIPPLPETPEASRPWFRALASLRAGLAVDYPSLVDLSMGMTDDFEVAIEEGATVVRVGRAIFGARSVGGDTQRRGL